MSDHVGPQLAGPASTASAPVAGLADDARCRAAVPRSTRKPARPAPGRRRRATRMSSRSVVGRSGRRGRAPGSRRPGAARREGAAEQGGPFPHPSSPCPPAPRWPARRPRPSSVTSMRSSSPVYARPDPAPGGRGVPDHVGQRLLDDPVGRQVDARSGSGRRPVTLSSTWTPAVAARLGEPVRPASPGGGSGRAAVRVVRRSTPSSWRISVSAARLVVSMAPQRVPASCGRAAGDGSARRRPGPRSRSCCARRRRAARGRCAARSSVTRPLGQLLGQRAAVRRRSRTTAARPSRSPPSTASPSRTAGRAATSRERPPGQHEHGRRAATRRTRRAARSRRGRAARRV